MTDETRPTEGRTPSDNPEPQGRPDFLPAGEPAEPQEHRVEPPASFGGTPWGDPSGHPVESHGAPPYEGSHESMREGSYEGRPSGHDAPREAPSFGPPADTMVTQTGPAYGPRADDVPGGGAFGPPSDGAPGNPGFGSPADGNPGGPGFGSPADGGPGGPVHGPQGDGGPAASGPSFAAPGGPVFGHPSDGGPAFGHPSDGGPVFGHPSDGGPVFGHPSDGGPSYGAPGMPGGHSGAHPGNGGTRVYESPFGGHGFGGTPPPPPRQALGMGPGWGPPPAHAPAPRRGPGTGALVVLALVIAVVSSSLGSVGTYLLTRSPSDRDPSYSLGPVPTAATNRAPDSVAGVAARVLPSVVSLEVGNTTNTEGATGSGFLIKNGYVVTNNHVVAMAAKGGEIRIVFNSRKSTTGRIVGRDPGSDLAVIKPEETFGTPEITLGNSDQVVVGDPVIAIGSPLGLSGTVTTGIVSSLNRPVIAGDENGASTEEPAYISAIQTDAAINPGNSGGPLVNGRGEVVGVNSAIATLSRSVSGQSGSIGLGFAIPVNQTRRVAEELITTGRAKRPKIGVVLDKDYKGQGVRIASGAVEGRQPVDAGGPADKAGLKAGDVILEIDGLRLQDSNELIALIRSKAPGARIAIKYQRAGQEHNATLVVMADETPAPTPS
uniref:trypsin-like peptidase domain-containing protein n=1 Tax=Nonomuraea pusilla TaxID=46177 RepID=UPI0006E29E29|nr:trypsin-like peptidase domain-containing protein [Nonomuraea pusilla]